MELRRQIEAADARDAQQRVAVRSEGAAVQAAEAARQAMVEVSNQTHAMGAELSACTSMIHVYIGLDL